jgi:hypothetical protein
MWELLRRFSALDKEARAVVVRAGLLLPLLSLSLRIRGFRQTQAMLQKFLPTTTREPSTSLCNMVRMVRAAARYGFAPANCLEQSLALWFLLGRKGIASELRVGTRKTAGVFEAHAWVECDGEALNETPEVHQHYAAFDRALSSASEAP